MWLSVQSPSLLDDGKHPALRLFQNFRNVGASPGQFKSLGMGRKADYHRRFQRLVENKILISQKRVDPLVPQGTGPVP